MRDVLGRQRLGREIKGTRASVWPGIAQDVLPLACRTPGSGLSDRGTVSGGEREQAAIAGRLNGGGAGTIEDREFAEEVAVAIEGKILFRAIID